jgi:propanol-preferring alcohol dehydrogenase
MKAAVITAYNQPYTIQQVPVPEIGAHDLLVRVKAAGICGTDVHILEGKLPTIRLPHIPGHESAGIVEQVGSAVTGFSPGDRVVVSIYIVCERCYYCLGGREVLCPNKIRIGFETNGGLAEYLRVPDTNAFRLPTSISFEEGAIFPDAVACMLRAVRTQARMQAGDVVVILGGIGGLGMQGIQLARLCGATVVVTSRQDEKLPQAEALGAIAINPTKRDLVQEIRGMTDGRGADSVIDNIGTAASIEQGLALLRPGGRLVEVAYQESNISGSFYDLVMREKEIVGSLSSSKQDLKDVIRFAAEGRIRPVVAEKYSLDDINLALKRLQSTAVAGRIVIIP